MKKLSFKIDSRIIINIYLPVLFIISAALLMGCTEDDIHKMNDEKMMDRHESTIGDHSMDMLMNNMMTDMHNMKMTGNVDVDFVNMMIIHHQAAVDMAKEELEKGDDEKMKSLADEIIKDQEAEIKTMKNWLDENKDEQESKVDETVDNNLMNSMMNMKGDMKKSGNVDIDFANMMIIHHQAAIDMSQVVIKEGKDPVINKMAHEIIEKQEKEISDMREWLKNK